VGKTRMIRKITNPNEQKKEKTEQAGKMKVTVYGDKFN
jgi:hypothetical protein